MKVADLGLPKRCHSLRLTDLENHQLPIYFSPEILSYFDGNTAMKEIPSENPLVDVYSFGTLLYEIYSLTRPYQGLECKTFGEFFEHVKEGGRPVFQSECPKVLKMLMRKCWATDPKARPSMRDACERLKAIIDAGNSMNSLPALLAYGKDNEQFATIPTKEKENETKEKAKEKEKEKEKEKDDLPVVRRFVQTLGFGDDPRLSPVELEPMDRKRN